MTTNAPSRDLEPIRSLGPSLFARIRSYTVMIVLTLIFVTPILYMFIGSLKPTDKVLNGLSGFLPTDLTFSNYSNVMTRFSNEQSGHLWRFYMTSAVVALFIVVGGLIVNSMAAYALSRLRWRGRDAVTLGVILLVILPFEAIAVPLYYMLNGSRNTLWVQWVPFVANAFSIYLFYTFFANLPKQLDEAARIDGAGPFSTFFRIIVPMSKPVFATVTILQFLSAWGAFLWPVLMVSDASVRPLPLAISTFQSQPPYAWGEIFAFGVLMVIPVLVVFLLFQRWFVQSVATAGLKG
ncbi:MAG TPA: carbohydrate ABC transporter permease [Miltoncostaeales bacterium]|jgi:multiple sugar transport system permease protein|nr:carbohydrate ABC transporter permease [Miltoncostaeales bacterium]